MQMILTPQSRAHNKRLEARFGTGRGRRILSASGGEFIRINRAPNTGPSTALKVKLRKLMIPVAVPPICAAG